MAGDRAQFLVKLIDKVSGPAASARKGIDRLDDKFHALRSRGADVDRLGKSVRNIEAPLNRAAQASGGVGASMSGFASGATALGAVAAAAAVVAGGAAVITAKFARATASALAFRDATIGAMTLSTKSTIMATRAFDDAIQLSDRLGTGATDTIASVQRLMAAGFDNTSATDLFKAMADLKVARPDANIGNAIQAITQIKGKGVLSMEELRGQLADAGLDVSKVVEAIGERIGKSSKDVNKLIEQGKISGDLGIAALLDSIKKQTGKELGDAAADASMGVQGIFDRVQGLPDRFMTEVAKSVDGSRFKGQLQKLWESIGPDSPAFKATVDAATRFAELLFDGFTAAQPLLDAFGEGFGDGFKQLMPMLDEVGTGLFDAFKDPNTVKATKALGKHFGQIAAALGLVAGAVVKVVPYVVQATGAFVSLHQQVTDKFLDLGNRAMGWGTDLIDGFKEGVMSRIESAVEQVRQLGIRAKQALDDVLHFGSPSKVMRQYGAWTGEGFGIGMESSFAKLVTPEVPMPEVMGPPANDNFAQWGPEIVNPFDARPEPLAATGTDGLAGGSFNVTVHITNEISGTGDPDAVARRIEETQTASLTKVFRQLRSEAGA